MINASSWALQYLLVALVVLLVGPVLSNLPAAQALPLTLFNLNSSQTIRLVVEGSGLTILCILSIRANRLKYSVTTPCVRPRSRKGTYRWLPASTSHAILWSVQPFWAVWPSQAINKDRGWAHYCSRMR